MEEVAENLKAMPEFTADQILQDTESRLLSLSGQQEEEVIREWLRIHSKSVVVLRKRTAPEEFGGLPFFEYEVYVILNNNTKIRYPFRQIGGSQESLVLILELIGRERLPVIVLDVK